MTPRTFKMWRKQIGLTQREAAEALGLTRRTICYYEAGEKEGQAVAIPRYVGLACTALIRQLGEYEPPRGR